MARSAGVISPGVPVVSLPVPVTVPAAVPQQEVRQAPEQVPARVQVMDRVVLIHVHLQQSTHNGTLKSLEIVGSVHSSTESYFSHPVEVQEILTD